MTDIEKKALALLNEVRTERGRLTYSELSRETYDTEEALCRAIEQHEAFRQEVSDALREWGVVDDGMQLSRFIIAKPDPLVEVLIEMNWAYDDYGPGIAADLREALAKRGGKIVWENDQ